MVGLEGVKGAMCDLADEVSPLVMTELCVLRHVVLAGPASGPYDALHAWQQLPATVNAIAAETLALP
jgi:hypothetical protein